MGGLRESPLIGARANGSRPITCLLADDHPIVTSDPLLLSSALESGARGFLLKEAPVSDLARAVKMVANRFFSLNGFSATSTPSSSVAPTTTPRLMPHPASMRLHAFG